jgi:hypothetical protein
LRAKGIGATLVCMRRLLLVPALALALAFDPGAATSESALSAIPPATITKLDLPVAGTRSLAASGTRYRFTLIGLHWRGSGSVAFRTRSVSGVWSGWRQAGAELGDAPDTGSPERRATAGWKVGSPWWVGPSDRVETRSEGRVSRIRAFLVWSPSFDVSYRAPASVGAPTIVPRAAWGADESIRRAPPSYASTLRFAIVHHTAGPNDYSRAQAPAIVRGIELYHVQANGWNDIGYNFLVDRFGTIYEGRYGGIDRNVIGAHALGFNTGSVGIAVLGTYQSTAPSSAAQDALTRLLAWRLDLAHVDPRSRLSVVSGGSERYPKGVSVTLRAVSGHRDTGSTECPGDALYGRLDAIAAAAARTGGAKIYAPRADVDEVGARFRATLSTTLPWTVSVTDATGTEVARGTGTGTAVDWTWDASGVPDGTYSWSIRAGMARPASGTLEAGGAAPALAIQAASVDPAAISPNGDQQLDASLVSFSLTIPANVTVAVESPTGDAVETLVDRVFMDAGLHEVVLDGSPLPDGRYDVVVTALTVAGEQVQSVLPLAVSRTLGTVSVTPSLFSPNGDGRLDSLTIGFSLASPAQVRIRILRDDGRSVVTPFTASLPAGPQQFVWNGTKPGGRIPDGAYQAVVDATDAVGTVSFASQFVSDTTPPVVRILPGKPLRMGVSEPATLTLRIDGAIVRRVVMRAGVVRIPWSGPATRVRVVAEDLAGNVGAPVVRVAKSGSRRSGQ